MFNVLIKCCNYFLFNYGDNILIEGFNFGNRYLVWDMIELMGYMFDFLVEGFDWKILLIKVFGYRFLIYVWIM